MMKSNVLYWMVGIILTILLGVAVVLSIVTKSDVLTSLSSIGSLLSGFAAVYAVFSVPDWIEKYKKQKLYDLALNAKRILKEIKFRFEKFTEYSDALEKVKFINRNPLVVHGGYTAKDIIKLQVDLLVLAREIDLIISDSELIDEIRNANNKFNLIDSKIYAIESHGNTDEPNVINYQNDIHGEILVLINELQVAYAEIMRKIESIE